MNDIEFMTMANRAKAALKRISFLIEKGAKDADSRVKADLKKAA